MAQLIVYPKDRPQYQETINDDEGPKRLAALDREGIAAQVIYGKAYANRTLFDQQTKESTNG